MCNPVQTESGESGESSPKHSTATDSPSDSPHSTWRHDRIEALVERGKLTSEQRNIEDRNSLIHYQAELLSARRQPLQDMCKKHSKLRHKVVST